MKKFILSLTLILTLAFGAVITASSPARFSARAETDVTIEESSEILEEVAEGDPLCNVWYKVDFTVLNTEENLSATEILRWNVGCTKVKYVNGEIVFFTSKTFSLFEVSGTIYSRLDGNYLYFYIPIGTELVHPTNTSYNEVLGSETVISSAMADIKKVAPLAWLDSETVYTSDVSNIPDTFKQIAVGDVIKKNNVFAIKNNGTPFFCVASERYFIILHYLEGCKIYMGEFNVPGTQIVYTDAYNEIKSFILSMRENAKNIVEYSYHVIAGNGGPMGTFVMNYDFGEVTNVYAGGSVEYISTFSVEEPEPDEPTSEPEDESTSESAIEDDSQKFIDKTTSWINDNLGLSLSSSFVGAVLLVLIISFFVNRAKK